MNQYFLACPKSKKAAIIDTGSTPQRYTELAKKVKSEITHLLQTHGHIDHVAGLHDTKAALPDAKIYLHKADLPLYQQAAVLGAHFGVSGISDPPPPDEWLEDGDTVRVGDIELEVMHTPGHCPGHVCLYDKAAKVLFAGDLLFQGSVGRTDLWGASPKDMQKSLKRLMTLPDDVSVFPGHGEPTTIGDERRWNPFLRGL